MVAVSELEPKILFTLEKLDVYVLNWHYQPVNFHFFGHFHPEDNWPMELYKCLLLEGINQYEREESNAVVRLRDWEDL
jgi:hypothetical protein